MSIHQNLRRSRSVIAVVAIGALVTLPGCGRNKQGSELQGPQSPGQTVGTNPAVSGETTPTNTNGTEP